MDRIVNDERLTKNRLEDGKTYVLLSKKKSLLPELLQQERGAGAEVDAEGEVEFLAAASCCALAQPALGGFYAGAQYVVAGKGVVIVGTQVGGAYAAEVFSLPDAYRAEEGAAVQADKVARGMEVAALQMEAVPQIHCGGGLCGESCVEGPERAGLLVTGQGVGLGGDGGEHFAPGAPVHLYAHAGVTQRLHAHLCGVLLSAAVVEEQLHRGAEPQGRCGVAVMDVPVGPHRKGFLVAVLLKDVALPVHPGVGVQALAVPQELESHFGVLRQVGLGVPERFRQAVVLAAVYVAQYHGQVFELCLRPYPRQYVGSPLVLVALPGGNVVIDIAGIAVGAVEDEGMRSGLQPDLPYGHIGELGLQPQSGQGIAAGELAAVFVVAEEGEDIGLDAQLPHLCRVVGIGTDGKAVPHLRHGKQGKQGQAKGQCAFHFL